MTTSLDNLPQVLQRRRAELGRLVNKLVERCATRGGQYLASDSPVDTGAFRSNWVMTLDTPFEGEIAPYSPLPKLGYSDPARKSEIANLSGAIVQHARAAQAFDSAINNAVYIRNNLVYSQKLQEGYSPQTAEGMLQRGLEAARNSILGSWRLT